MREDDDKSRREPVRSIEESGAGVGADVGGYDGIDVNYEKARDVSSVDAFDAARKMSSGMKLVEVRTDRKFWYGPGGALVTDKPIESVTQELMNKETIEYYGARFFVAESMTWDAAVKLAELLGGNVEKL